MQLVVLLDLNGEGFKYGKLFIIIFIRHNLNNLNKIILL